MDGRPNRCRGAGLLRGHATVDHQFRAGDPGGFVGRQEQHAVGDILGGTEPTHWRAVEQNLARGWIAEALLGQRRVGVADVELAAGDVVLADGTPIHAAEVGVLAGVQKPVVRVGRRPVVAILSTGDEIIDIGDEMALGKVVNSNSYSLAALVREAGAIPRMIGIVPDTPEATVAAIESALESDFIISSGGVSAGAYDFVNDALDTLGAETKFSQVSMKPGKPVVLSRVRGRLYFGLPGNPVSCMVSFLLFIAPAIRKAMGQTTNLLPPIVQTRVTASLRARGDRRNYMRVRVTARDGELVSQPMASQGSGVSTSMVQANGLVIVEAGITAIEAGSMVPTVLVGPVQS